MSDLSSYYIKEQTREMGGGGEILDIIELVDGKCIVMGYGQIGIYKSKEIWWEGVDLSNDEILFMDDIETARKEIGEQVVFEPITENTPYATMWERILKIFGGPSNAKN